MAVGRPLIFTPTGAVADANGGRFPALPARSCEASTPVVDDDGEPIGTLRAIDLAGRAPLDLDQRRALADVAALIAGAASTRARIGQLDHVTGVPNRRRFERDFAPAARIAGADPHVMLVTIADARHYNEILRALGHLCAEDFVRCGADQIRRAVGGRALYHVSVLSFAFFIDRPAADEAALAVVAAFRNPVVCNGLPIVTWVGVGVAEAGDVAAKPAEILRSALAAAQDSRRCEKGFAYYDRRSDEAHLRAFSLLTDLRAALEQDGQLALAYQPRIDLATGIAAGAEALIRWTHPTLGPVSPAEFVPLAETTALIDRLTDWVLDRACRQSAEWRADGLDVRLSVNVSPSSLHDSLFLDRVTSTLGAHSVAPDRIEFEFTEGVLASTEHGVRATIDAIRAMGSSVAIDDFGTGYANLSYLTRLPADVLKIDRSFVQSIEDDPRRRKLVRSMIDLSHDLGFSVVAEGVETQEVYDMLAGWGCDEGQGFLMSRPLAPEAFAAFAG